MRPKRPRDPFQLAHQVFQEAIGEAPPRAPKREKEPSDGDASARRGMYKRQEGCGAAPKKDDRA